MPESQLVPDLSIADAVDLAKSHARLEAHRYGILSRSEYDRGYDELITRLIHNEVMRGRNGRGVVA